MFNICVYGAPERKALDKIQVEIGETEQATEDIGSASLPHEEMKENLTRAFSEMRARGGWIDSSWHNFGLPDYTLWRIPHDIPVVDMLLYLLGTEELVKRIMERISKTMPTAGLPAEKRPAKIAELEAKRVRLLEAEELEILRLEEAGHTIVRREAADAKVLLRVWGQKKFEAAA